MAPSQLNDQFYYALALCPRTDHFLHGLVNKIQNDATQKTLQDLKIKTHTIVGAQCVIHSNDVCYLLEEQFIKYPKKTLPVLLKELVFILIFFDSVSHIA